MNLKWEAPPALSERKNTTTTEAARARRAALHSNPGEWARIAEYAPDSRNAADSFAHSIRRGKMNWATPAGSFEAAVRRVDGKIYVYARYVGY